MAALIDRIGRSHSHVCRQLGQLHGAGLVSAERQRGGDRPNHHVDTRPVEDLRALVQTRLRQQLKRQQFAVLPGPAPL